MKHYNEVTLSQLPAMKVLHNLGWKYLSREQVRKEREGNSSFLLQDILEERLAAINGGDFTKSDITTAIRELSPNANDLIISNIEIYKLLISGTNIDKSGDTKVAGFKPFKYMDWDNLDNNHFHFTCEFDASQGRNHKRIDVILFVNGIPMAVVECKSPWVNLVQAKTQIEGYQTSITRLFSFVQIVAAINAGSKQQNGGDEEQNARDKAQYASIGGDKNYWAGWREEDEDNLGFSEEYISGILNADVPSDVLQLMDGDLYQETNIAKETNSKGGFDNDQNRFLISLFNRERFLDLVRNFIIIGNHSKKMALSHQYFVVKNSLIRVGEESQSSSGTRRAGGVIWHTQGSGKSMVMILLIKNLQRSLGAEDPRVILVSDRLELNDQMVSNLKESNLDYKLAKTGKDLRDLIINKSAPVILANVHKFENAVVDSKTDKPLINESKNIFLLVDECHRTQYGDYAKAMRRILPNGCYIGFTGTPLLDRYKNSTFATFGEFITPSYPIKSALKDKTVVRLMYEARETTLDVNDNEIDQATAEATKGLSTNEANRIKRNFSSIYTLRQLKSLIGARAKDIAKHYISHTGLYPEAAENIKAQLVAPSKAHAILYHQALTALGIASKVIISPPGPDNKETEVDVDSISKIEALELVNKFWETEIIKDGRSAVAYERQAIQDFKESPSPQILIVVDKLITGFDAPKNTILYLCKSLKDHTLLQAIARVNRVYPGKKEGLIVDYNLTFGDLKQALNDYDELQGYTSKDLEDTLQSISGLLTLFEMAYQKIKDALVMNKEKNSEEHWDNLIAKVMSKDNADRFCQEYRRMMELYAQLASTQAFHDKYREEFDEINKHIRLASQLYRYIMQLKDPTSKDMLIANELMLYALNNSVTANSFSAAGEPVAVDTLINPTSTEEDVVEDQEEKYDGEDNDEKDDKDENGNLYKRKYFQDYHKTLSKMEREIKDSADSHPHFAEKMSELIKEALDEFQQMVQDFVDNIITMTECESRSKKLLENTGVQLEKYMKAKNIDPLPSCLADMPDALEYFHVLSNMLPKDRSLNLELEQALCDISKNTLSILEGDDHYGWCDDIDAEKKVRFAVRSGVWTLEDEHESFPKEQYKAVADKMLDIGRARSSPNSTQ